MRLIPHSFNGFLFQQENRVQSDFNTPYDWNIQGITTSDIPRSVNFPLRVAKNYAGSLKVVNVNLLDVDFTRDSLVIAMDVLGEDQSKLIALDEFGRSWYVNADFVGLLEDSTSDKTASFGAVFAVDEPIWKKLVPSTQTILVNGTGTGTITPLGNVPALPVITVTTQAAGGFGFTYKQFITVINNSPNALINYPLDLTDGGMDTAALVGAGKMLASGDDLRIYVGDTEIQRWFGGGGMNSATTTIWVNWNQPASSTQTLGANIAGTGDITEIQFKPLPTNIRLTPLTIPNSGLALIGSEIFAYTDFDEVNFKLTGITRHERGSSAAAHTAGATIYFIPDAWLYYGYAAIEAYNADDTYKMVLDLINSTNTLHVWADLFGDTAGLLTGAWQPFVNLQVSNFPTVHNYTGPQNTMFDPWTVIGTFIAGTTIMGWKLFEPCGVTDLEVDGQAYSVNSIFGLSLDVSNDGIHFLDSTHGKLVYSFAVPSPLLSWQPISSGAQSLSGTYFYVRFRSFQPPVVESIFHSIINQQYGELSDISLTLDSTLTPTISRSSEDSTMHVSSVITNAATGESLLFDIPMGLNAQAVINTKERTITLYDGTNAINALLDMPLRPEWLQLLPAQANVITITDAGQLSYKFDYEDRYM